MEFTRGYQEALRILVVTNLYPTSERPFISTFVKEQVESLRSNFPDLTVDVRVIEGIRPRWPYLREMLLLPVVVKKGGYDIVHAHFGLTLISTLFVRVPVVITFHGSDLLVNPTKHISRLLAPMTSKVIVVSKKLKESLGYGEVIPCGIDVKKFALPGRLGSQQSPQLPGSIKVLFPSDPSRKVKDYKLFSSVCAELEKMGNRVERIHMVNIDRTKVPDVYWNCDVMLLTSLSEGSPTVIKEAIAAKLPFVSVDVGDVKEWAELVEFGVVTPNRDPKTLADAVTTLLNQRNIRSLMGNEKCLEAMDIENLTRRIRSIYDDIVMIRC